MKALAGCGFVLGLVIVAAGCAGGAKSPIGGGRIPCDNDEDCNPANACVARECIARTTLEETWAFEIIPPAGSPAAPTELIGVNGTQTPVTLTADRKTVVTVTVNPHPTSPTNAAAIGKLIVTSASLIAGRPELRFEATRTNAASGAVVTVPSGLLGRPAQITILPLPPDDLDYPPISYPVEPLGIGHVMTLPKTVPVQGQIVSVTGQPVMNVPFVARAYQQGRPVSNAPVTDAEGRFRLYIPEPVAGALTTVQISPQDRTSGQPWFVSKAFVPATDPTALGIMGKITLPPYLRPDYFRIELFGESTDPPAPISGAVVRVFTTLDGDLGAGEDSVQYLRDTTTDDRGNAHLALIPTDSSRTLPYQITVVPSERELFATHCQTTAVQFGGATMEEADLLTTISVPRRPVLSGRIVSGIGTPIPNVVITATPNGSPTGTCVATGAAAGTIDTDHDGRFSLPLDPGTYRLEYVPPAGSKFNRMTEPAFPLVQSMHLAIILNEGAPFDGTVIDADGNPVPMATVRIFEPACAVGPSCPASTPPVLHAQTQSDAQGRFRAIVRRRLTLSSAQ